MMRYIVILMSFQTIYSINYGKTDRHIKPVYFEINGKTEPTIQAVLACRQLPAVMFGPLHYAISTWIGTTL